MASIEDYWKEACEGFDDSVQETWFNKLQKMYSDEKRTYHNLEMLREKLANYSDVKEQLKNSQAMLLAIFFQNFEYDPKALDGENTNIDHFTTFANEAGISSDADICLETCILLRAAATHSTDAHKVGGAYGEEDAHYLLDLDMAILGAPIEKYTEYRERIREEYSFLSEPMYTALRLKVLQNFVQIPNIFATKEFREKFEERARENINMEIEQLS